MKKTIEENLILDVDSYKGTHYNMYPPKTEAMYSYFESRVGAKWHNTVFFGLQYYLKRYFEGVVIDMNDVEEAKIFFDSHIGPNVFNYDGWKYIVEKYEGRIPLKIKAVPEGSIIPVSNILISVECNDSNCFWLTNWFETQLSRIWYSCSVATLSRENKKIISKYRKETGGIEGLPFALHNFGSRGSSSSETAAIGDMAHLVNFLGSDTIIGNLYARKYYNTKDMLSYSVKASEHSSHTSWGGREGEVESMRNAIEKNPTGILSLVCDSYDLFNCCANILGGELKEKILARDGVTVCRPDSGIPTEILPEIISILGDKFGFHKNDKGYLVLNDKIRILWGDGIKYETIPEILEVLKQKNISAENLVMGSGAGLIASVDRDTQKFAFKCSEMIVDGKSRDVFKQPITDSGKNSKKGRLALIKINDGYQTIRESELNGRENILQTVFENGEIKKEYTFEQVRENAKI